MKNLDWVVKSVNKHAKIAHMGHGDEPASVLLEGIKNYENSLWLKF